ncbi:LPS assembly protein LptD [Gammaproteobacteria bacterium]|nr:LPS assembly protein LptD [Gammaproteobacteria bacterium]
MKKTINLTICVLALFSTKVFAQDFEEDDFFCCSVYELHKASAKNNESDVVKRDLKDNSADIIYIEADESFRDENKQITILNGDTKIIRGPEILKSELANVLQLEDRARLSGNVEYENEGLSIEAPYAEYNTKSSRADFIAPVYKYSSLDISGKARYGVRLKNKTMFLKNSTYTTCDLINPDWNLISETTELDFESGVGKGKNVYLTVRGVPVFYSPYMQFSLDEQRKTGFLVPDFSGSWVKGPDIITPFYWNIAANMDMLIQPSYIQDRGKKIESDYRYLNKNYSGSIFISYLDDDSEYKNSAKNARGNKSRYNFYLRHQQALSDNLEIDFLYDKFSDKDYFDDFGTGISRSSTTYKTRHAKLNYNKNGWDINSRFLGYQTFDKNINQSSQPYDLLPEINVAKRWDKKIVNYDLKTSLSQWNHVSKVDGTRADIQIGLDKTFLAKGISVTPRLKIQHTRYDLEKQNDEFKSNPSKTIPIFSLDSIMTLSKQMGDTNIAHQIKPRMFYLYSAEENQDDIPIFDTGLNDFSYAQLFRDNSFSGLDRNNDTNQLTFSLSSSFYNLDESRDLFTLSIGQILYLEDRNVSLDNNTTYNRSNSNIVAELEYNPTVKAKFTSTYLHDSRGRSDKTQKSIHSFQYRGEGNNVINASYRYRKNDIEQGDLSFAWGINSRLNLLGRWNYDFKNNLDGENSGDIETLAGLEYESCCWKARLVQRKFKVDAETYEKDIQFQVMLKGFTDVGTPLGDLIAESIKGYTNKEY